MVYEELPILENCKVELEYHITSYRPAGVSPEEYEGYHTIQSAVICGKDVSSVFEGKEYCYEEACEAVESWVLGLIEKEMEK